MVNEGQNGDDGIQNLDLDPEQILVLERVIATCTEAEIVSLLLKALERRQRNVDSPNAHHIEQLLMGIRNGEHQIVVQKTSQ